MTPVASCSSADSCECVVDAGWITRLRTSPMLATWLCSSSASTNRLPASSPPSISNASTAPAPRGAYFCAQLVPRAGRQAGVVHRLAPRRAPRATRRPPAALATCRSMRRLSVSRPWAMQERVERRDRRAEVAQQLHARLEDVRQVGAERRADAEVAGVDEAVVARVGLVEAREAAPGRRRSRTLPPSTITPPIEVPCPPRYFVAECTTMSAPHSNGRIRYGVATVLSTISGTPASCATRGDALDVEDVALAGWRWSRRRTPWCSAGPPRATSRGRPGPRRS